MFARVTTYRGSSEQIEEGIRIFREDAVPWLREATGFRGWIALVDKENERAIGISFWTTRDAASDTDASGATLRDEVAATVGTVMQSTEFYEVAVAEALALDEAP